MPLDIDLGSYNYCAPPSETSSSYDILTWRLPKEESLSDWTIIIQCDDNAAPDTIYNVHRIQLGVGPRRSEYFDRLFHTQNILPENDCHTSRISLESSAADAFPVLLDYMYSLDGVVATTTQNSTALRHLANYFGVRDLFTKANDFIKRDLSLENVTLYWREAVIYNDDRLIAAMVPMIATTFESMDKSFLFSIYPHHLGDIISSSSLNCDSELLSLRVAEYLRYYDDSINKEIFYALTHAEKMPRLAPETAVYFVKLDWYHLKEEEGSHEEQQKSSLFSRCVQAFLKVKQGEMDPTDNCDRSAIIEEYKSLPVDLRLRFMESTLDFANDERELMKAGENDLHRKINELQTQIESMEVNNKTLQSENEKLASAFKGCIIVNGAGKESVNGVYTPNDRRDDCVMYTKVGKFEGQDTMHSLYRYRGRSWYISFWPDGNSSGEIDIYKKDSTSDEPPPDGWETFNGEAPPPKCMFMT